MVTICEYDRTFKIVNTDQLARGTGARYLEVMNGENGEFVALQWRRKPICADNHLLIDFLGGHDDR